ncbi:MAG: ATP-binding protein, partial [Planctomycetaceae bacterium]
MQSHHQSDNEVSWEVQISSEMCECHRVVDELISRAEAMGVPQEKSFALRNGLHEAVVNAVRHGNQQDPEKQVRIAWQFIGRDVWIEVEDQGDDLKDFDVTKDYDEPMAQLIATIMARAVKQRASDIHFKVEKEIFYY